MFKELFALTEHAPVLLLVAREGERLRVNLTRKKDEDEKSAPLALSILATPEELDAELPLALAEGFAMSSEPDAVPSVADQVKTQAEATATAEGGTSKKVRKVVTPVVKKMTGEPKKARTKKPAPAPKAQPKPRAAKARKVPLTPTPALVAVVGDGVTKHNDAMVKVWDYIKAHDLKGKPAPKGGSWINADDQLRPIFGGKDRIASTQLAKLVKAQFVTATVPTAVSTTPVITPLIKPEITFHGGPGVEQQSPAMSVEETAPLARLAEDTAEEVSAPATQESPVVEPVPEAPVQASSSAPTAPAVAGDAESLDLF